MAKIAAVIPEEVARAAERTAIHAFRMPDLDSGIRARLDLLDTAIRDATRLDLAYTDASGARTTRPVRPLGLVFWGKVWTLVAWCDLRDDFRMFRVDRIAAADPAGPFKLAAHQTLAAFYAREAHCAG